MSEVDDAIFSIESKLSTQRLVSQPNNAYAKITDVAKKLGIEPSGDSSTPRVAVQGRNGEWYDLFQVVLAHLERMDEAIKKTEIVQVEDLIDAMAVIALLTKHGPMQGSFSMSAAAVAHDRARQLFYRMMKKYDFEIPEHLI